MTSCLPHCIPVLTFSDVYSTGVMWGTGSAIGHRAVDAVLGPRTIHHETVASTAPTAAPATSASGSAGSDACMMHSKAFQDVSPLLYFLATIAAVVLFFYRFHISVLLNILLVMPIHREGGGI